MDDGLWGIKRRHASPNHSLFTYKATGNRYPASQCVHLTRRRAPVPQRLDRPIPMQKVVG